MTKIHVCTNLLLLVSSLPILAQGYGNYVPGQQGMGSSGAFTARAEDASAVFYNPAGLAQLRDSSVAINFRPVTSRSYYSNAGQSLWSTEASTDVTPEVFANTSAGRFGFGFGFTTTADYEIDWQEPDFPGRFLANGGSFRTQEAMGAVAFRLTDHFSIGAGLRYVRAESSFSRALNRPVPGTGAQQFFEVGQQFDNDGTDTGFHAGLQYYRSRRFSIGASYQSSVEIDLDGDLGYSLLSRNGDIRVTDAFNQGFRNGSAASAIELPERFTIGFASKVTVRTRFEANFGYTDWSAYQTQNFTDDNGETILSIPRNWDDTYEIRLAGDFQQRRVLLWRIGLSTHRTVVPDDSVDPSFPDFDHFSYSFGASYTWRERYVLEGAILYEQNRDRNVTGQEFNNTVEPPDYVTSNGQRGLYETQRYQLNLGVRIKFNR